MKQLTQADLSNLSEKYTWLAISKNGELHGYEQKPVPCDSVSGYEYQRTAIWLGRGFDATDWENSAVRREGIATKQLTQAVFEGMPKWIKSARIDKKGKLVVYSLNAAIVTRILNNEILLPWDCGIWDSGYDTTDWQNSAIDREVTK